MRRRYHRRQPDRRDRLRLTNPPHYETLSPHFRLPSVKPIAVPVGRKLPKHETNRMHDHPITASVIQSICGLSQYASRVLLCDPPLSNSFLQRHPASLRSKASNYQVIWPNFRYVLLDFVRVTPNFSSFSDKFSKFASYDCL